MFDSRIYFWSCQVDAGSSSCHAAIPAELVCCGFASATQQLGAKLSLLIAPHLPSEAAVHSAHEDCATFGDLHSAFRNVTLSAWCLAAGVMMTCDFDKSRSPITIDLHM